MRAGDVIEDKKAQCRLTNNTQKMINTIKPLLPRLLVMLAFVGVTGFASSSNAIIDHACQGGETTIATRVDDEECTKTTTYYGIRAVGLCTGKDSKCKEETVTGPCDVILENEE